VRVNPERQRGEEARLRFFAKARLNTNRWNRLRYTLWAPFYDRLVGSFDRARADSLRLLDLGLRERVLIVGAGTGADLPLLPAGSCVLATDLTPAMLRGARSRLRPGIRLALMDGQQLAVASASVDAVVLHLILAVIPDPVRCLQEAARALRPGGRMVVFDKFVRAGRVPLVVRLVNPLARVLFTEMTRDFEVILAASGVPLVVTHHQDAFFGGLYRSLLLRKTA
jgi:phosphatidylethanolamine/phosphatidyl-N-methylethanolamine N-methyltransferase